jgi:ribose 5-phosphate isomerase B
MKVIIAADHAGYSYKTWIIKDLHEAGYETLDLGGDGKTADDDYPDYAEDMAIAIREQQGEKGILICGSGVGVSVAANKFKGIRAGVCHDTYSAHQCVEHDNVNVLCIGERVIGIELAREIVFAFLGAKFSKEARHKRRLGKILAIEDKNMKD